MTASYLAAHLEDVMNEFRWDLGQMTLRVESRLRAVEVRLDAMGDAIGELWLVLNELDEVDVPDLLERVAILERRLG